MARPQSCLELILSVSVAHGQALELWAHKILDQSSQKRRQSADSQDGEPSSQALMIQPCSRSRRSPGKQRLLDGYG